MPKVRYNRKPETGHILLKFRYRRGQLPFVYYTGQHIEASQWNAKNMRARTSAKHPENSHLNDLLQRLESELTALHRQWLNDDEAKPLTNEDLKAHLDRITKKHSVAPTLLIPHMEAKMVTYTKRNTRENWEKTIKALKAYSTDRRRKLKLADVNDDFRRDFERWSYDVKKYAISTVWQHFSIIKTAVRDAIDKELVMENKTVHKRRYMPTLPQTDKNSLHEIELAKLLDFDFEANMQGNHQGCTPDRLRRMADIIIVACDTGLRSSDLKEVKPENIRNFGRMQFLKVFTQKKEKSVEIPLTARTLAILQKYDYRLPAPSRAEILSTGRKVLQVAGIDRTVTLLESSGGQVRATTGKVCDHFSGHWTRRTFATESYLRDASLLPAIQAILGHATPQQTLDYMDLNGRLTAEHFAKRIEIENNAAMRVVK